MRPIFFFLTILIVVPLWGHPDHFSDPQIRILVFTRTAGFRHDSIPAAIRAVQALGQENGFAVDATEDAGRFTDAGLAPYQAVVFLNTTGDVLAPAQERAFERYIRGGGGFVGVHAAADTEYDWPWYGDLVGAYFASHPAIQSAQILVADPAHPATAHLPARWDRRDEWYNYRRNPRNRVHILATLDERSYDGGDHGSDHPIAWCHPYDGGRAWYTGGGHTRESYGEPLFLQHLLGGIEYASGAGSADCGATLDAHFEKTVLDAEAENPIDLTVAPDGRVFYVERRGVVKIYHPDRGRTTQAGRLAVTTENEDGLLGIALDPNFADNRWLYLFYSPQGPIPKQHVSRFVLDGDLLVPESEAVLLEIPTQRRQCCHSGGALVFGPDGSLYIGVGDNTNPFESDGYSPLDERPGRAPFDAQRTSANSADLRGKILRVKPTAAGGYTVPPGNLFTDTRAGRPEIYVMGVRNPFRLSVDQKSGWLYWGDVGPDARTASVQRGPAGLDEWNQARAAGNFGWPYCIGDNAPYRAYDFAAGRAGPAFDCAAPRNISPNNTGLEFLPPAQPAWLWYPYGASPDFPQIVVNSGRTAMAGPVYQYDPALASATKLPAYYDGTLFMYDWASHWLKAVKLDEAGQILTIHPFLDRIKFTRPIALKLGPDGALYLLEWGSGFGGNNPDAQLVRIDYIGNIIGTRPPVARIHADPQSGATPLEVTFSGAASFDPDPASTLRFAWDFTGDGQPDATGPEAVFTYGQNGDYTAQLTVTDPQGNQGVATVAISAGNTAPVVDILHPPDGGFFAWGEAIDFELLVRDREDREPDCGRAVLQAFIGHDEHGHPLDEHHGCRGRFTVAPGHGGDGDNIFYTVEARYTDNGAAGVSPLTGRRGHILQPKRKQAEHYSEQRGVQLETTGDIAGGGQNIGFIAHGDWISFAPVNLAGVDSINYRVASAGHGGQISVHVDGVDGPQISTVRVRPTGDWQVYTDLQTAIEDPGGTRSLFFVFTNSPGDDGLFNINWVDFIGPGISRLPSTAVVREEKALPQQAILLPPYPNPFNPQTRIRFVLPADMPLELVVFDVLGQPVRTLLDEVRPGGAHVLGFDGLGLASGVYIVRLVTPFGVQVQRMALVR